MSRERIAKELGLKKRAVASYLERAAEKLERFKQSAGHS
jgi:DNA-directed RNA polymerase specialized sigma24 family protein